MDTVLKVAPSEPLADLTQSHSHSHSQTTAHQNVGQCTSESPQGDNQTTAHQNVGQCTSESPQGGRPKKPAVEKGNLQARYWSYLFDNLHRAVEELYTTCEADESVVECQEVVMSLEMCCKDFVALIQRIELQKQFEGGKRPPSVAWEVRKITSPSKPLTSQHTRPHTQAGTKWYAVPPTQSGAKRCLDFRVQQQGGRPETCSRAPLIQTPPTTATTTTAVVTGTKASSATTLQTSSAYTGTLPIPSQTAVSSDSWAPLGVTLVTARRAQTELTATASLRPPPPPPPVNVAKLIPRTSGHMSVAQTLSWADRVRGKVSKDCEVKCHSGTTTTTTSSTSPHGLVVSRCEPSNAAMNTAPLNAGATRGKVAGVVGDGWELAHGCNRIGRRSRRLHSSKIAKLTSTSKRAGVSGALFRVSSDPGFVQLPEEALVLKKSSSVVEEATSPLEQSVSSSGSLEAACLVAEPEGALPGPRGTTPLPKGKELTCLAECAGPAATPKVEVPLPPSPKGEVPLPPSPKGEVPLPPSPMGEHGKTADSVMESMDWNTFVAISEANKDPICWADRSESPPLPEVPRSPGRAVQLHQKFSSPNRKRPIEESIRILEERQVKAQLQRGRLQEEKTHKLHLQTRKVLEVREYQDALSRQRREEMDEKMHRAEHLRESFLQEIVKKAQSEEAKVCEIAFINSLEAQNKRIEVLQKHEDHWARVQHRQREKQRRHQEHQAREEAAQQRHRLLETERQARLIEKERKRREQDAKREQLRSERDKAREEALREKARERERKREARNLAFQMSVEELERRIQLKQDESSKRYDLQLEQIKERASSVPRPLSSDDAPCVGLYHTQKWCTLCKIKIISPVYCLSHLRGKRHQEVVSSLTPEQSDPALVIIEAPLEEQGLSKLQVQVGERLRAGKKRARKLKQKMAGWAKEQKVVVNETVQSKAKSRLQKVVNELNKVVESHGRQDDLDVGILGHLDHVLSEISRVLSFKISDDIICFCQLGGVTTLVQLLVVFTRRVVLAKPFEKTLISVVGILRTACGESVDVCARFILTNQFAPTVELLVQYLATPQSRPHPHADDDVPAYLAPPMERQLCLLHSASLSVCPPLLSLLGTILSRLSRCAKYESHVLDCIGLLVSVGFVDRLSHCFAAILVPIIVPELEQLVIGGINLLIAATGYLHRRVVHVFGDPPDDTTQLLLVLKQTELGSLLTLLYAILLHDGPPRHSSVPPPLSVHTLALAMAAFKALNNIAIIDLKMMQACLGSEGISLEFRHVVSYLLWHCSHYPNSALLQELILSIGYCCVLNSDNQVFLQSGRSPTLLQLMCGLPFDYFTKPELTGLLYPTLIAACYNSQENVGILSQEISCKLMSSFLQESMHIFKEESKAVVGVPDFYSLPYRFPKCHWESALQFFSN